MHMEILMAKFPLSEQILKLDHTVFSSGDGDRTHARERLQEATKTLKLLDEAFVMNFVKVDPGITVPKTE